MGYIIKTDTIPANLPAGATVEREPRTFPAIIQTPRSRKFTVTKDIGGESFIQVEETGSIGRHIGAMVGKGQTRELAHALLEAIGDDVPGDASLTPATSLIGKVYSRCDTEPPAEVTAVKDKDGDTWYRHAGGWNSHRNDGEYTDPWSYISRYAPMTVTEQKGNPQVALPVTVTSKYDTQIEVDGRANGHEATVTIRSAMGSHLIDFVLGKDARKKLAAALLSGI